MANFLSKNSQYVSSLVAFINDVKPFSAKLSEIVEEYQFNETANVKISERLLIKAKLSATWKYNYFSGGNPLFRTMPAQRLVQPALLSQTFRVGEDENTDLASVPYAYSKKSFDGPGVNAVFVKRAAGSTEYLTESVDYFQSHGSFEFRIYPKPGAVEGDTSDLRWATTNDDGVIAEASIHTLALARDATNPTSAISRIRVILDEIRAATLAATVAGDADVMRELDALYAIIDEPARNIPQSYESLLTYLSIASPPIVPYLRGTDSVDPQQLEEEFSSLTSPLFFNAYTDIGFRNSGGLAYANSQNAFIRVTNVVPNLSADYEEWTLTSTSDDLPLYSISGSTSGIVGFITAGQAFTSSRISFSTTFISQASIGDTLKISPLGKIVIADNALLETWNIIKVNPIAHDRPQLTSTRYGSIQNISFIDSALQDTNIILTARSGGQFFDLISTADPTHTGVPQVGVTYSDSKISFKIQAGTTPFYQGDRFFLSIENLPAHAENVDLGYGYDLDAYDDDHLVYNNTVPTDPNYNRKIGFYYDGRFTDYDLTALDLQVADGAVNNRKWRVRALPTGAPIATLKKDGSGPSYYVDLTDSTSGISPDPALNSIPVYSMSGDPYPDPDLYLYYTTEFIVEYSDNNFSTYTPVGNISAGGTFESILHGIQFTLVPASRPFIAVSSDDGGAPRVEGGDVFSFTVINPPPTLIEPPGLLGAGVPRLIMHSDSFYAAEAAKWTVEFGSETDYTVSAVQPNGIQLPGTPLSGKISTPGEEPALSREGFSFKELGVHFTVVPAGGLGAGDKFTFNTFTKKPSYLVHGSITGWTPPATVDEYYWNGKIGFKLTSPQLLAYINDAAVPVSSLGGAFSVREDTPSITYLFTQTTNGYIINRSDVGIVGWVEPTGTFKDQYLTASVLGVTDAEFKLSVNAHDFTLWNSADLVILNPKVAVRLPAIGDDVVIEKAEDASIGITLTPSAIDSSDLIPASIDQRFIDLDTHQTILLSKTSPETTLLRGWLPIVTERYDSATSVAEFSDQGTRYTFKSAGTGALIGELRQQDASNVDEPIIFEWDPIFFGAADGAQWTGYLPLNAEANIIITGTGWDDKLHARITESIKFMIGPGALTEDWLFHDDLNISVSDNYTGGLTDLDTLGFTNGSTALETAASTSWRLRVSTVFEDAFGVSIADSPFGGFLSGFDNNPFDAELGTLVLGEWTGDASYDAGIPLVGSFIEAQQLVGMLPMTPLQAAQTADERAISLNAVLGQINPFLTNGDLGSTPLHQFLVNINADPTATLIAKTGMGFPALGLGIDVQTTPEGTTSAAVQEIMVLNVYDYPVLHDEAPYDTTVLDTVDERTATLYTTYTGSYPPAPVGGTLYANYDTPFFVVTPARVFEVVFSASDAVLAGLTPTFLIWLPTTETPVQVNVVQRVSPGRYRFSIASASEAKILTQ
jgi:hypothetical protein